MSAKKPSLLKIISGTVQPCRTNPDEPVPEGELTEPPEHFNGEQAKIWRDQLAKCPPGMLKKTDGAAFEAWCMAYYTQRRAAVALTASSLFVKAGPNSETPVQSPALSIMNKSILVMHRLAVDLGFTPVARSRVRVDRGAKKSSPFGELKDFKEK